MLEAGDLVVLAGEDAGAVERARGGGVERVDREARLARARDAGDAGEGAKRDGRGDVSQVVRGGAAHGELLARALAAVRGHGDFAGAVEVIGGDAAGAREEMLERAVGEGMAARTEEIRVRNEGVRVGRSRGR